MLWLTLLDTKLQDGFAHPDCTLSCLTSYHNLRVEMMYALAEAAAARLQEHKSAVEEYIAEQLHLISLEAQDGYSVDGDGNAELYTDSSRCDPGGRGLEAFQDVLASWLTAAHTTTSRPLAKAQASLPLRPKVAGQNGEQPTLQRIWEQQQQMVREEAKEAVKPSSKKETKQEQTAEEVAKQKVTAESEDDSDDQEGSGVAGSTDVMSGWMSAAGVKGRAKHAQHATAADVLPQQGLQAEAAATPSWLAAVSSDDDYDADQKAVANHQESGSMQAPSTASLSDAKPHKSSLLASSSPSLLDTASEQPAQHAQHATAQHVTAQQPSSSSGLPPLLPYSAISVTAESAFPKPTAVEAKDGSSSSGLSPLGVSSQDRKLDLDVMSKAKTDLSALWPSASQSYPALMPKGEQGSMQLPNLSPPAPVYSADQGLAPQAFLWSI